MKQDGYRAVLSKWLARTALVVWATVSMVIGTTLMVGHWYVLPMPPTESPAFLEALQGLRPASSQAFFAVHVLYGECKCSRRVLDHLFTEPRLPGVAETVLLVGQDDEIEKMAKNAGFTVTVVDPEQLKARYQIESAPLMLVLDGQNSLRYAGGYTERKQGMQIRDVEVLEALLSGKNADELPLYGCGTSKELQAILDPIGVKYR